MYSSLFITTIKNFQINLFVFTDDFVLVHKNLLVNTFLNGCKDTDSLVRASSLSNLGQICLVLKNNIDDILYEVSIRRIISYVYIG